MYRGRGLPIYITWLDNKALSLFADYQVVVLGDREFCSVQLAAWLRRVHLTFVKIRVWGRLGRAITIMGSQPNQAEQNTRSLERR
ncbi:hypothetical protein [Baaleninema simplex]|uniref:hypothetical protein n=1 Tax=Baaleninema simplex TaxID=2862350 RepID=UPI001181BF7F|nr:hypothetical protein [Baaleninema simplex]